MDVCQGRNQGNDGTTQSAAMIQIQLDPVKDIPNFTPEAGFEMCAPPEPPTMQFCNMQADALTDWYNSKCHFPEAYEYVRPCATNNADKLVLDCDILNSSFLWT